MKSLREKLMAVSARPPKPQMQARPEPFYCREHIVPLEELGGVERTTLEDVRACDPAFSGDCWDAGRLLFLDTETTGLSGGAGTVAFEIGVGFIRDHVMVIRQYVMRDYHEEAAMLDEIAALFAQHDIVVSFNGKSFDLPLLESRMILNRIRLKVTQFAHFDLLHAARRVYKMRLQRCNLASLETSVLGHTREDDLPGAMVPQRYFDYLKSGEFALLEDVLRHNFDDVKSLAVLTAHLCGIFREPQRLEHAEDMLGVGRTLLRTGCKERGRACLKILGHTSVSSQAHMYLAASYKRDREWDDAVRSWQEMIAAGEGGTWPYIEMAKYQEHVRRDYAFAMNYAKAALAFSLNSAPLGGGCEEETQQLLRRITRLRKKISMVYPAACGQSAE